MNRRNSLLSLLAATAALAAPLAQAQEPIRLIVPYAPGGPLDITSRALAERVRDSLGVVIIENKAGAGGNIGADAIAKASPDGLTIGLAATATHAVNPWLYSRMPYDAAKDFAGITQMVRVPNVLVVNADFADLSAHQVYACGAPIVVDSARSAYTRQGGLPEDEFFADAFTSEADKHGPA